MAWTSGPTHILTGIGERPLARPSALAIIVDTVPVSADIRVGSPSTLYGVGHLSLGTAEGWTQSRSIHYESQLELLDHDDYTRLGHSLQPGGVITVTELVAPTPDVSRRMPWDRYVGPWSWSVFLNMPGPTAATVFGTYTSPPDKWLWISSLAVQAYRTVAATTAGLESCTFRLNSAAFRQDLFHLVGVSEVEMRQQSVGGLVLPPSSQLSVVGQNYDVGGAVSLTAFGQGYTYLP